VLLPLQGCIYASKPFCVSSWLYQFLANRRLSAFIAKYICNFIPWCYRIALECHLPKVMTFLFPILINTTFLHCFLRLLRLLKPVKQNQIDLYTFLINRQAFQNCIISNVRLLNRLSVWLAKDCKFHQKKWVCME
jgi:hypothetical protein